MSGDKPPEDKYGSIIEKIVSFIDRATLRNVVNLALIVIILTPAYVTWRFVTDPSFRQEWVTWIRTVPLGSPCLVINTSYHGREIHNVLSIFNVDEHGESYILLQTSYPVSSQNIKPACDKLLKYSRHMQEYLFSEQIKEGKDGGAMP